MGLPGAVRSAGRIAVVTAPTWILILTVMNTDGVTVEHVPGFSTYTACTAAGDKWGRMVMKDAVRRYLYLVATCVRSDEPNEPKRSP